MLVLSGQHLVVETKLVDLNVYIYKPFKLICTNANESARRYVSVCVPVSLSILSLYLLLSNRTRLSSGLAGT